MIPYVVVAKFPGRCLYCGGKIKPGETIAGETNVGAVHTKHFSTEELKQEGFVRKVRDWHDGKT